MPSFFSMLLCLFKKCLLVIIQRITYFIIVDTRLASLATLTASPLIPCNYNIRELEST